MVEQTPTVQVPGYAGVNIQIFNPTVATPQTVPATNFNTSNYTSFPCYPPNYYTQNFNQQTPVQQEKKKTEKRDVVVLTDQYIKVLENNLNNQNKQVRLMAAKEILARLQEDDKRKDDPALNALVNKMLQDPYEPVKFIAMAALESRHATGDNTSVAILQNIQKQKTGYGEDSLKASNVLMKMSGKTVQKEFEVKESSKNKDKE